MRLAMRFCGSFWVRLLTVAVVVGCAAGVRPVRGAEYQFSVATGEGKGRAFLWIPPGCMRVRGLIVAEQVILEETVLADPAIRAAAARQDLGIVIDVNGGLGTFQYNAEGRAGEKLDAMLKGLAEESGYAEVAGAPLLPIGHSGSGIFCWNLAYWKPSRVFGVVTLHSAALLPPAWDPKATADGIPVLAVCGQYESWGHENEPLDKHWRWLRGNLLNMRSLYDESLTCEIVQPGAGHFSWTDSLARHVAMFIEKAAAKRIPAGPADQRPVVLNYLPVEGGWLTDVTMLTPGRYAPAAYGDFTGDPALAFWHMDEELARAAENFDAGYKGKQDQRVTFVRDGRPVPAAWIEELPFEPIGDGMTVKVAADFLSRTPRGAAGWGKPLTHADGPIKFRLIGGWGGGGEQTGPDTFRIKFDHFGINRRTCNLQIMAYHEGDATHQYAEQPTQIKFPEKNLAGKAQTITFPQPADVKAGTAEVALGATSDSGLPVEYFVQSGPGRVRGDKLLLTAIPPRTTFPVKVTVVAYQWGRPIEPLVKSAASVERQFNIIKAE